MSTPEGALLRLVLDYLSARHVLAYRMQSAFTVAEYKGKNRAFRSGTVGMADILAFPQNHFLADGIAPPRIVWLELKAPKGRQTEWQASFQAQVESHGMTYAIIRSLEDVEAIL